MGQENHASIDVQSAGPGLLPYSVRVRRVVEKSKAVKRVLLS